MQPQNDNLNYLDYITNQNSPQPQQPDSQGGSANVPVPGALTQPGSTPVGPATPQPAAPQPNTARPAPNPYTQSPQPQTQPQGVPPPAPQPQPQVQPQPVPQPQQPSPAQPKEEPDPKKVATSAQNSLLIAEVRDGVVIMRDGSLRAVVMCQSINFDLMSNQERESIEFAYQGFLNSLYFPVQIVVRSIKVDLDGYMQKLEKTRSEQQNILLQLLMEDYIAYVNYLLENSNIMDKQFFVVVPYYPPAISQAGLATGARKFTNLFKQNSKPITINETDFNKYRSELSQRTQVILNGLHRLGIQSVPLNTPELIELYYSFYNPETAANQGLSNIQDLEAAIVTRGSQPAGGSNPSYPNPGGNQ